MTWARLDDAFWRHRKYSGASLAATGLQARALSYCNEQLNDGHLTPADLVRLSPEARQKDRVKYAAELVTRGVWEEEASGWYIHDFPDYNRLRADVQAERAHLSNVRSKAGSKGAAKRWQPDSKADGKSHGKPMAPYPDPIPIPKTKPKSVAAIAAPRSDPVFEVLAEIDGVDWHRMNSAEHGKLKRARGLAAGWSPDEIRLGWSRWGDVMGDATCTAIGVMSNIQRLLNGAPRTARPTRDRAQEIADGVKP